MNTNDAKTLIANAVIAYGDQKVTNDKDEKARAISDFDRLTQKASEVLGISGLAPLVVEDGRESIAVIQVPREDDEDGDRLQPLELRLQERDIEISEDDRELMARAGAAYEWVPVFNLAALGRVIREPIKKTAATENFAEESAFPNDFERSVGGLTKREYFAAQALASLNPAADPDFSSDAYTASLAARRIARDAIELADALIEELAR